MDYLRYFPKGHVKKEYALLSPRILEDQRRLKELVDASITYVCDAHPNDKRPLRSHHAAP